MYEYGSTTVGRATYSYTYYTPVSSVAGNARLGRRTMSDGELSRCGFIRKAGVVAGAAAALSLEERILLAKKSEKPRRPAPTAEGMPMGKIGNLEISRLICGGNLISGFAHSRDLVYVSSLFRHYFTDEKIVETFEICEANGINTLVTTVDEHIFRVLEKHRKNGDKLRLRLLEADEECCYPYFAFWTGLVQYAGGAQKTK